MLGISQDFSHTNWHTSSTRERVSHHFCALLATTAPESQRPELFCVGLAIEAAANQNNGGSMFATFYVRYVRVNEIIGGTEEV